MVPKGQSSSLGEQAGSLTLANGCRYILISPVKDEEKYVETTLRSVVAQTLRPHRWVIVDDGSQDSTPEILRRYAEGCDWIQVVRSERATERQPGSGVVGAFAVGYELVAGDDFDFLVKLDCDLELPPNYFERLCAEFRRDESLGIASGIYFEHRNGSWVLSPMPAYHAAGAAKMVRKKCYSDIGGFLMARGWDTVDEIRAVNKGWKTCHFPDLPFRHLKNEGTGVGSLQTYMMHGEIYYLTAGGAFFFLLKLLHRFLYGRPYFIGGAAMLWGYLRYWITQRPRLVSRAEARLYKQMLNRRIWDSVSGKFRRTLQRTEA
jgi:poly-beta-1,6-N-acetyl-D-glucosamine synthase